MATGPPNCSLAQGRPTEPQAASGARPHSHCRTRSSTETVPGLSLRKMILCGAKESLKKPAGKMSSCAFLVQTCWEGHRRKSPERWKTMSAKDKGQLEDMAKLDGAHHERQMKTYLPPKGGGDQSKKIKDPNAPRRPPSAFFSFCSECCPKMEGEHPSLCSVDTAKKRRDVEELG
ncbi:Hypothetical predicted protein, partial [Lynx pardinus]